MKKLTLRKQYFSFLLLLFIGFNLNAQEICNNGKDDDGDALVDLNDTVDCICDIVDEKIKSIIPNPSFEENTSIPNTYYPITAHDFCANEWKKGTAGSIDYLYEGAFDLSNFLPQPFPDGKAAVGMCYRGGYWEFAATNLVSPIKAGEKYAFNFSISGGCMDDTLLVPSGETLDPIDFYIYGSEVNNLFPITTFACPDTSIGFEPLGKVTYNPDLSKWTNLTINIQPSTDINSIMIGGPCDLPSSYFQKNGLPYFALDNFVLNKSDLFSPKQSIDTSIGSICEKSKILIAHPAYNNGIFQWYKEGIAIKGANDTILKVSQMSLGNGTYEFRTVKSSTDSTCAISSAILISDCNAAKYTWPNVFTPNGDDYNEFFTPKIIGNGSIEKITAGMSTYEFTVYDRWGLKMFDSKNEWPKWNGKFNENDASASTYYWVFKYYDNKNNVHFENGYVTLIR